MSDADLPLEPPVPPPVPSRLNDSQVVFDSKTDAYLRWQEVFRNWQAGLIRWVPLGLMPALNAIEGNKNAAQQAAIAAETSAQSAAGISGAARWMAGDYAQGVFVWSPTSLLTYRRRVTGASAIDPAADPAGWKLVGSVMSMPQQEITTPGVHQLAVGFHYLVRHPQAVLHMPVASPQEQVRIDDRSDSITVQVWPEPGGRFRAQDVALLLATRGFSYTFTQSASEGWT